MYFVAIIKMCYISFEKKLEDIFLGRQLTFFFFFLVFVLCILLVSSYLVRNCYTVCAYFRADARTFQVLAH
jgi:flagellar biogenesis protein FliO